MRPRPLPASTVVVTRAVGDEIVARRNAGQLHADIARELGMSGPLAVIDVVLGRATVVDDDGG